MLIVAGGETPGAQIREEQTVPQFRVLTESEKREEELPFKVDQDELEQDRCLPDAAGIGVVRWPRR